MTGRIFLLCGALLSGAPQASPAPARGSDRTLRVEVPRIELDLSDLHEAMALLRDELRPALAQMDQLDEEDEDADQAARDERNTDRDRRNADRDQHRSMRERRRLRFGPRGADDEGDATARARGRNGAAALAVQGPVTMRVRLQSGEVEVLPSEKSQVAVNVSETRLTGELQLVQYGDNVELEVGGRPLRRGHLRVELPRGSNVEFDSTSADVSVQRIGGDVRVRTMSGDVKIAGARKMDVETISGDVTVDASGNVRLHTVSGNAVATTADPAVHLDFESASGNLDWSGTCGKGCHLAVETVSGEIKLAVDPKSSFELAYSSHSGELRDDLKLDVKRAPKKKHAGSGGWIEAIYGKGEGIIECDAFSGDVHIRKK